MGRASIATVVQILKNVISFFISCSNPPNQFSSRAQGPSPSKSPRGQFTMPVTQRPVADLCNTIKCVKALHAYGRKRTQKIAPEENSGAIKRVDQGLSSGLNSPGSLLTTRRNSRGSLRRSG